MKRIIYIFILFFLYSCSNISSKKDEKLKLIEKEDKIIEKIEKKELKKDIRVKITNISNKERIKIESDFFFEIDNENYTNILIKKKDDKIIFNNKEYDTLYLKNEDVIQLNENKYYGDFLFKIKDNNLLIINIIDIEKYLEGVLPFEIPASFPLEALKAQAVIARTYAYFKMKSNKSDFDLDDTIKYQVYKGKLNVKIDNIKKAIETTKNLVITYNNELIDALFHSYSGGYTASAKEVYDNDVPYLVEIEDPYSEDVKENLLTWNVVIDNKTLLKKIGFIPEEYIIDYSLSNRVKNIFLKNDNQELNLSGRKFRQLFNLKSTSFTIDKNIDNITVVGSGFGHGVGFSQWSSKTMANRYNMKYEDIIKFFYKDVEINFKEN